ncbi:hypothetical protein HRG_012647 [Hirsutella rhossiliensis]
MPALVVRDQGYQPVLLGSLPPWATSCIPPIVSFTGLIVGTGHSSLRRDLLPGPGAAQLNCCGFVRLSTYVAPGMPNKVPFKGFHPFQVFVIFPVRANPGPSCARSLACSVMMSCSTPRARTGTTSLSSSRIPGLFSTRPPPPSPRWHRFLYATEATSFLRFRGLPGRARCLFVFDHPWHPPAQSSTLGFGFALDRPPYAARETILP